MDSKQIEDMFYVMKDATCCLNGKNRDNVFNSMCHTLHEKWDVEKNVLADFMENFGYFYMVSCYECGEEFEWDKICKCIE